ncbi:peptidogalycan biosysnthesis protein [Streptomyces sp. BPTC-684]|uniref:peptidogalycan biosysnthesis protein n=1 Tax=Streptomyces sp. BPTC-684 TaxID=3043734 RepID=UPI0024B19693|nr:peptidogalycan biosysnthesis protein [Streptomyces sp. BPTC-684]WHM40936.1 peptidogalycan biosysnthesis protein [Streptomyces sp. BPTC-684]
MREQWDALVGPDNFYNSYGWLRSLELAHGSEDIVTASCDGTLLGALPTWPGDADGPGLFCLPDMLPGLALRRPADYLWLGARRSVYNELVCVRGELRHPTLTGLVHGALTVARARGAAGLVLPYLAPDDAVDLARAHPRARVLLHDADANMDVPAGGSRDQFTRMSQPDRTRRRAELRACDRAGTVVKWLRLTGETGRAAADLVTQNRARYGGTADPALMRRSFAAQRRSGVLEQAVGCFGIRAGRPLAVTVCYTHHDRLYARYYGFDYRTAEPACEYFVLTYRAPLDYAAAHGLSRYRLAVSAWNLKARRGATLSPLAAVVLPLDHEVCSRERALAFNRAVARRWRQRCAARPQAMGTEWGRWDAVRPGPDP